MKIDVAPLVGARIEIMDELPLDLSPKVSLPSRERGLKSLTSCWVIRTCTSLSSRERGLKCTDDGDNLFFQHGRSPRWSVD